MNAATMGAAPSEDRVVVDVDTSRLGRLAAAGMAWSMVKQWGSRVISLVMFMVLARALDPSDFGLVAFAAVFIGFLDIPLRTSLGDALVQKSELRDRQLNSAFCGLLGVSAALALIMVAAAPVVGRVVDNPDVVPVIMAMSLGLPLTGISVVPESLLRRRMKFKSLAVRKLAADFAAGLVAVALAFAGAGVWALVGRILVWSVVMTAMVFASVEWRPRLSFSWAELRDIAVFGGWSTVNSLLGFVVRHADDLIIGATLGSIALGYYVIAYQLLVIVVLLVTDTIDATALAAFSRLQDDTDRVGRAFAVGVRSSLAVVMALAAMTVALAPSIVVHIFGDKWLPTTDVLRVLILGALVSPTMSLAMTVMKSRGRPDLAARHVALRTLVAVIAVFIGASFGLIWVGVAQIVTIVVMCPLYLRTVARLCNVPWRSVGSSALRLAVAGAASGVVAVAVAGGWNEPVEQLWQLIASGAVGSLVYVGLVWLLARNDIREVSGFVRKGKAPSGRRPAGAVPEGVQS